MVFSVPLARRVWKGPSQLVPGALDPAAGWFSPILCFGWLIVGFWLFGGCWFGDFFGFFWFVTP